MGPSVKWRGQPSELGAIPRLKSSHPRCGDYSVQKMKTDIVGIFRQEDDAKGEPAFYLTRSEARILKSLSQGFFINHGHDMRLLERIEKVEETSGIKFSNPFQSRSIKAQTSEAAIDAGKLRTRREIEPGDFMRGRLKPLAVVAVESWA